MVTKKLKDWPIISFKDSLKELEKQKNFHCPSSPMDAICGSRKARPMPFIISLTPR